MILAAPRFVAHHRRRGLNFQFRFYLQSLWPFLRWLLAGPASGLSAETCGLHQRTRRLFLASAAGFFSTAMLFLLFVLLESMPRSG